MTINQAAAGGRILETARMDPATQAAGRAAALGTTLANLERAALENGSVSVELRGLAVRAIAHRQGNTRRVCWELDGAGISRANLLAALTRAGQPAPTRWRCACGVSLTQPERPELCTYCEQRDRWRPEP